MFGGLDDWACAGAGANEFNVTAANNIDHQLNRFVLFDISAPSIARGIQCVTASVLSVTDAVT